MVWFSTIWALSKDLELVTSTNFSILPCRSRILRWISDWIVTRIDGCILLSSFSVAIGVFKVDSMDWSMSLNILFFKTRLFVITISSTDELEDTKWRKISGKKKIEKNKLCFFTQITLTMRWRQIRQIWSRFSPYIKTTYDVVYKSVIVL